MINNFLNSKKSRCLFSTFTLICLLLIASCAPKPPYEKGGFKTSDLVELVKLDSTIHLDIRYATNNNILERPVYK
jgi:D-alanyl-D-alanine dipeptidase